MWHRPLLLIQKIFLSFKQTLYFNNQQYFSIKDLNVDFKNNDKEEVREAVKCHSTSWCTGISDVGFVEWLSGLLQSHHWETQVCADYKMMIHCNMF